MVLYIHSAEEAPRVVTIRGVKKLGRNSASNKWSRSGTVIRILLKAGEPRPRKRS